MRGPSLKIQILIKVRLDTPLYKNYTQRHPPTILNFCITNQNPTELNNIQWNSLIEQEAQREK